MDTAPLLARLRDADDTAVTNHALERGYSEDELVTIVEEATGLIYWDRKDDCYHLVTEDVVVLVRVQLGTRIVITAYPTEDITRYHDQRYTLVRG